LVHKNGASTYSFWFGPKRPDCFKLTPKKGCSPINPEKLEDFAFNVQHYFQKKSKRGANQLLVRSARCADRWSLDIFVRRKWQSQRDCKPSAQGCVLRSSRYPGFVARK
jgi:hypothetical protein